MTRPMSGFGRWVLFGPKIEEMRQRLYRLVFPASDKVTPDYGPNDRNWFGLRILDKCREAGTDGVDMNLVAKSLIDIDNPDELAAFNSVLRELDERHQSQDLNCA